MAGDSNYCCDLAPHPQTALTWTGNRAEGKRYQLINKPCFIKHIEIILETSGGSGDSTTVKFFTAEDPAAGSPDGTDDLNIWQLTIANTVGSSAWTPEQFCQYFQYGVYAEVMSGDTGAKVNINIRYYDSIDFLPAVIVSPTMQYNTLWHKYYPDTPIGEGHDLGSFDVPDYADTTSSSTPSSGTGSVIEP